MNQETDRASSLTAHTITPHLVVGGAAQAPTGTSRRSAPR